MTCCLMTPSHYHTWTYVDLSSLSSSAIHLSAISQSIPQPSITKISLTITILKFHSPWGKWFNLHFTIHMLLWAYTFSPTLSTEMNQSMMASNHYLNPYWFIIKEFIWHSPDNFRSCHELIMIIHNISLEITLKKVTHLPGINGLSNTGNHVVADSQTPHGAKASATILLVLFAKNILLSMWERVDADSWGRIRSQICFPCGAISVVFVLEAWIIHTSVWVCKINIWLTHVGPGEPCGIVELGHHWLRYGFVPVRHQAITWINDDLIWIVHPGIKF